MLNSIKEKIGLGTVNPKGSDIVREIAPVENLAEFSGRYKNWRFNENLDNYPFVANENSTLTPMRRALPMLNLALISSAGAYIDGTDPFEDLRDGDPTFREIPVEVEAEDLAYAARGYDAAAVRQDMNAQIPVQRLLEFEGNNVIGRLNRVWWSLCGFVPNARLVAEETAPRIAERIASYEVQAALLIPASRLCHQTLGIVARALEQANVPTIMISVDREMVERVRPPRASYYEGEFGSVAGKPGWKEYQRRILDKSLRWMETFDQPGVKRMMVDLETEIEQDRGER